ncbi:hypothetical protein MKK68_18685 [Methylobacterium sp. E-016]|uniref:hypothetical protein n=1 Tax=Methylobacterium sp. E-016 TaxID=2836556 RepID=UPI001FB920F2|nr:hypothetical protein [Methylobacterium sp. E-016]MCJ2077651.1 hypothetical protein [Methylobacterium sp. E-016]
MSDTALRNAMLERDRLAAEINQIQQRVHDLKSRHREVDDWISAWHSFAGTQSGDGEPIASVQEQEQNIQDLDRSNSPEETKESARATGNPKKEFVAAESLRIISEAGKPLTRSELFAALKERSIIINGRDPEQVLSTMLWRAQRDGAKIVRLKSGGYWLADHPHFESAYNPARDILASHEEEVKQMSIIEAVQKTLMNCHKEDLIAIDSMLSSDGSIPEAVSQLLINTYPDLISNEIISDNNFLSDFHHNVHARMKAFGYADEEEAV